MTGAAGHPAGTMAPPVTGAEHHADTAAPLTPAAGHHHTGPVAPVTGAEHHPYTGPAAPMTGTHNGHWTAAGWMDDNTATFAPHPTGEQNPMAPPPMTGAAGHHHTGPVAPVTGTPNGHWTAAGWMDNNTQTFMPHPNGEQNPMAPPPMTGAEHHPHTGSMPVVGGHPAGTTAPITGAAGHPAG